LAPVEPADNDVPAAAVDQPGSDVTARLVLALTALYVQRANHTAEEQQQYTELALGLIDKAGAAARTAVAMRLERHPDVPAVVLERLRTLQFSLDGGSLQDRNSLAGPPVENDPSLADGQSESTPKPPASAAAAPQPASITLEFGEAFFAEAPAERLRMLSLIADARAVDTAPEDGRRFHVRIDSAAWRGRAGVFVRDFEQLIDAPKSLCERVLNDPSGEPMVIAAKATGMPVAVLQRILLLASPAANHSVARVYELTELYHGLHVSTARDLLAVWRDAAKLEGKPAAPAPVTDLRARFRALNARVQSRAVISRSGPESGVLLDLRSR
jgi:hypothetical protein